MIKWDKGRKPDKEDLKDIEEIFNWINISLENKDKDEWYKFASLQELANHIESYFMKIGYWTK